MGRDLCMAEKGMLARSAEKGAPMATPFEEEEVEVCNEEVMTLSALQWWTGKLQVELRVLGRLRIGEQLYRWDKVLCVPLHPLEAASADEDSPLGKGVVQQTPVICTR